ncbi:DMT family transporter [Nitratireductor mangrovi]|uniref:DMT family transporter n=1 Tax=Nitratireductor mangrovi TaxID=2599600 RepID=A0A5B8L0H0_9HYPH|nr:DMT family transporter [Nitratireductor mangrovi]QDZ01396.1 DMT family transporter [Nitratireductor mangrovi]
MNEPRQSEDTATPVAAILLVFGAGVIFSFLDTSAKYLGAAGFAPPFIAWTRFAVHVALAVFILQPWKHRAAFRVASLPKQVLRGMFLFGATFFNFLGLKTLQLAEAVSIFFFAPMVITALAGPFLGEWAGWRRWAAIIVGLAGVLVITRPGFGVFEIGHLYVIGAMLSYSSYVIMTRQMSATETPESLIFYSALTPVILMAPAVPLYGSLPQQPVEWIVLLSLGFYGGFGHWLLIKAYRQATTGALAPYPYLQMVWMIVLGYLVFGDLPDRYTVAGAAIIVASGLYIVHRERRLRLKATAAPNAETENLSKKL